MTANRSPANALEASPLRASHLGALHLAILLVGAAGLFAKWISTLDVTVIVWGRAALAALVLIPACFLFRRGAFPALRASLWLLLAGGTLLALHWATFFHAIRVSSVTVGLLAFAAAPVFVAFLEPWWKRQRPGTAEILAALLGLAGLLFLPAQLQLGEANLLGLGWGVLSGLLFACVSLILRALVARLGALLAALGLNLTVALVLSPWATPQLTSITPQDWLLLALLGVFCTALANVLLLVALRRVSAHLAVLSLNLEPLYAIILAALFLDERPGLRVLFGGALIISSTLWMTRRAAPRT